MDSEPIEFANVSLYKTADSSFISGTTSEMDGGYLLEEVSAGNYYVKISYIGYRDEILPGIKINDENKIENKGLTSMRPGSVELAEMIVSGEKNVFEVRLDKKIFNVSKSLVSKGGDGLDVLRNIPSIDVDANENVSLRGDQNVIVLVDGRRISMSAGDYLKMFPASAIDKVEIMTNPSAKYDPEGMSGIINIIMNKEKAKGFSFKPTISSGYGKYGKVNGSAAINMRRNKVNLTANLASGYNQGWFGGTTERSYTIFDSLQYQNSSDNGTFSGQSRWGKLGIDYFLDDRNTLYFTGSGWQADFGTIRNMHFDQLNEAQETLYYSDRTADEGGLRAGYEINTGWQKKFKNNDNHTLDLDLDLSISTNDLTGDFSEYFVNNNIVNILLPDSSLQNSKTDDYNMVMTNKLDYVNPINLKMEIEAGFHSTTRQVRTGLYSETFNQTSEQFYPDTFLNNDFNYDQQVYAVYGTFGHEIKKYGYKVGLRAEQTNTTSFLKTTGEKYTNDYFSLFPSTHLSYKWNRKESIQLSYSRRIDRPDLEMLNPFPTLSDPYTVQIGNPFIRPEYIHVFELGYNKIADENTFNGTIYYRRVNDLMQRFLVVNELGQSVVTFRNFSSTDLTGAEGIWGYRAKSWWRMRTTFNLFQSAVSDQSLDQDLNFSNYGWSIHHNSYFTHREKWTFQVSGRYMAGLLLLQGRMLPMYNVDLAVNKRFHKKRGNISLRASDIFNTRKFRFKSDDLGTYSYNVERSWESRTVFISLSYSFGRLGAIVDKDKNDDKEGGDDFEKPDLQ